MSLRRRRPARRIFLPAREGKAETWSPAWCLVPARDPASAMLSSSALPLLLPDGDMHELGASASFRDAFDIDPRRTFHVESLALGQGERNVPQPGALLSVAALQRQRPDRHRTGVEALARKSRALIQVDDRDPGTAVRFAHPGDATIEQAVHSPI